MWGLNSQPQAQELHALRTHSGTLTCTILAPPDLARAHLPPPKDVTQFC